MVFLVFAVAIVCIVIGFILISEDAFAPGGILLPIGIVMCAWGVFSCVMPNKTEYADTRIIKIDQKFYVIIEEKMVDVNNLFGSFVSEEYQISVQPRLPGWYAGIYWERETLKSGVRLTDPATGKTWETVY